MPTFTPSTRPFVSHKNTSGEIKEKLELVPLHELLKFLSEVSYLHPCIPKWKCEKRSRSLGERFQSNICHALRFKFLVWHFWLKSLDRSLPARHRRTCLVSIPAFMFSTGAGERPAAKWTFLHGNTICGHLPKPAVSCGSPERCSSPAPVIPKPGVLCLT